LRSLAEKIENISLLLESKNWAGLLCVATLSKKKQHSLHKTIKKSSIL